MIRRYIVEADDSLKGFDEAIEKLEREWGAEEIEGSEDCVSRENALNGLHATDLKGWQLAVAFEAIEKLPSVTPQPKRGKWIFNENMHDYCCSECGCLMPNVNEYYRKKIIGCPYCLADMREVQDDGI